MGWCFLIWSKPVSNENSVEVIFEIGLIYRNARNFEQSLVMRGRELDGPAF